MSTKTTFKRIALVAVAALGLGVLSVAPSSAAVSGLTVTVTNGAATLRSGSTTAVNSDSTTAATIAISALRTAATDSITVAFYNNSTLASGVTTYLGASETTTSNLSRVSKAGVATHSAATLLSGASYDSSTAGVTTFGLNGSDLGNVGANFKLFIDSKTASKGAGTYTYSLVVTVATVNTGAVTTTDYTYPVSIVVSANAADSTTPSAAYTVASLNTATGQTTDSAAISKVATAGNTSAYLAVDLKNAAGTSNTGEDTVTVTITGPGLVNNGSASGKSIVTRQAGLKEYTILSDGTAGTTTITVALTETGVTFTKSMSFFSKAAKTITAAVYNPVLAVGDNSSAVAVKAVDANGTAWTGDAYIVASSAADALVAGSATTPVKCSAALVATTGYIFCPVTAATIGTAKFKVIDASTVALATATSNEVTVTVKAQVATSVKIAFDKATYAPNEKALITVTPLDATGSTMQGKTWTNLLATGGITSTSAFAAGSMDSLTAVSHPTEVANDTNKTAGSYTFVVYMPSASGDVTISATGGTSLPAAGQVKITATATVVNASVDAATDAANEATDAANAATDAALAAADAADAATAAAQDASDAVAALSATVAKLVASLKAQITSLTNLVIKIQKKVRA